MNNEKQKNRNKSLKFIGPLFIVGCPRSGTGMLLQILNNHHNIQLIKGEDDFLNLVYGKRILNGKVGSNRNIRLLNKYLDNRLKNKKNWEKNINFNKWMDEFSNFKEKNYVTLYTALMIAFIKNNKTPQESVYIGSKNPHYLFYIDLLIKLYPNAKFLNIIRDPRAVAASMIQRKIGATSVIDGTVLWKKCIETSKYFKKKYHGQFISIYYEDLINNPKSVLKDIYNFLHIKPYFDIKTLSKSLSPHLTAYNDEIKGLDQSRINKYKEFLNADQIKTIESVTAKELIEHRYQLNYTLENTMLYRSINRTVRYLNIKLKLKKFKTRFGLDFININRHIKKIIKRV